MPRRPGYSEGDLREAVADAHNLADTLRRLGLRAAGGNFATVKRMIADLGISTEHFDPSWGRRTGARTRIPLEDILVTGSSYDRGHLKARLYAEGIKSRACEICGQTEDWNGQKISLILDHINGTHDDNRLENLRIVCPNCNAALDTHCGKQTRLSPRGCLRCGESFRPRNSQQNYCSQACGVHSPARRHANLDARKVERPSHSQLLRELEESNYSAVGRRYGVSDNAVRKWVRAYEYQAQHAPPGGDPSLN